MSKPKITHVFRSDEPRYMCLHEDGGWVLLEPCSISVANRLRDRAQRVPADVDLDAMKPGDWFVPEDVPTPTPLPDGWFNLYPRPQLPGLWPSRAVADSQAGPDRIAVVHIWTDEDGVDRAEVIRP